MLQGHRSMPILSVKDVGKSTDFFTNGLGFSCAGNWRDEDDTPSFAIVVLDRITIALRLAREINNTEAWAAYLYVEDLEAYVAQVTGSGVKLASKVTDKPYGCREIEIADPDGNILCFGQDLLPGENGPGL